MEHVDLVLVVVDFELRIFQLLEHVKLGRLRIIEFLFELHDIRRCTLKLFLEFALGSFQRVVVLGLDRKLLFDIFFLTEARIELEVLRLLLSAPGREIFVLNVLLIDAQLVSSSHLLHFNSQRLDHSILLKSHLFEASVVLLEIKLVLLILLSHGLFVLQLLLH